MGSPEGRDDERPIHRVAIGPFSIGTTPVTNLEYAPFLASGGGEPPPWWSDPAFSLPRQPVVGVSWEDASRFAAWLAESAGGTWRLPTEAEWEFAAFGGLDSGAMPPGEDLPPPEVPDGPLSGPWEVGRGAANGYGLFDMGTIVHEWCLDWYAADYYAVSPAADPQTTARTADTFITAMFTSARLPSASAIRTVPIRGNGAAVFTLARIRANISPTPPRPSRPAQLVADFTCR